MFVPVNTVIAVFTTRIKYLVRKDPVQAKNKKVQDVHSVLDIQLLDTDLQLPNLYMIW
uniref:Uncharacterized protein n=1 Tax=Arion vulgaris TaxID=1028688 RepID=A0A0B6Z802_9EUPU